MYLGEVVETGTREELFASPPYEGEGHLVACHLVGEEA
jgi:hypothetical protein